MITTQNFKIGTPHTKMIAIWGSATLKSLKTVHCLSVVSLFNLVSIKTWCILVEIGCQKTREIFGPKTWDVNWLPKMHLTKIDFLTSENLKVRKNYEFTIIIKIHFLDKITEFKPACHWKEYVISFGDEQKDNIPKQFGIDFISS